VWGLPFCEAHGREAAFAADEELLVSVDMAREGLVEAETNRFCADRALVRALESLPVRGRIDYEGHDRAMLAAYPPDKLEGNTDAETLAFDYASDGAGDGPYDWWSDARLLMCRFMRQAAERGEPAIMRGLE
jgi:hypothetical protein